MTTDPTQLPERRNLRPPRTDDNGPVQIDVRIRDARLRAPARVLITSPGRATTLDEDREYRAHYQIDDGVAEQMTVKFTSASSNTVGILAAAMRAVHTASTFTQPATTQPPVEPPVEPVE